MAFTSKTCTICTATALQLARNLYSTIISARAVAVASNNLLRLDLISSTLRFMTSLPPLRVNKPETVHQYRCSFNRHIDFGIDANGTSVFLLSHLSPIAAPT
jgi:hypothetical protein